MSTLNAENTQLKSDLEAAQKASAALSEERDVLKASASAPVESTSVPGPLDEELERLREEKNALEQALQEEKSKQPVQTPAPDTSDLEARLVRWLCDSNGVCLTLCPRPPLHRSEINFSQKRRSGKSPRKRRGPRLLRKAGKLKRRSLSRVAMKL